MPSPSSVTEEKNSSNPGTTWKGAGVEGQVIFSAHTQESTPATL